MLSNQKKTLVYALTVNNNGIVDCITTPVEVANSIGMLIGMNIINRGDFAITNYQGKTSMSFRTPSVQKIDFVAAMKEKKQIINDKIPGRNEPCPCGSGKKHKHCCGDK